MPAVVDEIVAAAEEIAAVTVAAEAAVAADGVGINVQSLSVHRVDASQPCM
jgi:hypothetical protein